MKQKEAQAIRRLIQEKDAQDRGMGREQLGCWLVRATVCDVSAHVWL